MSTDSDIYGRTRSAGQIVFVIAALAVSLLLLSQIGRETLWVEDAKFAAQPRFWPLVALIVMIAGFGLHLFQMRRRRPASVDWVEVRRWAEPLEYVGWFMAYVFTVPVAGFLPVSIVFAYALTWRLGYRKPLMLASAVAFAIALVIVFKALLGVKIPGAMVYEYLPDAFRSFFLQYL